MNVGIVGAEGAKFLPEGERQVRELCRQLLADPAAVVVSGACHLGGVDVWAEEEYRRLQRAAPPIIHPPKKRSWADGYKPRNILIAQDSDVLHNIVVAEYHEWFNGMRFKSCYHCGTDKHVKSGGCWTAKYAQRLGKEAVWHIIWN